MKCDNCQINIKKISFNILDNFIEEVFNTPRLINSHVSLLEKKLQRYILSFITNMDGHRIIYTRKSRSQPEHMDYDSDDEISGYYWTETKNICTKCFQYGIHKSLDCQNRLPYLRCHIGYFLTNKKEDNIEIQKKNRWSKPIQSQYSLPNTYIVDYYRQSLPDKINNKYVINCK